MVDRNTPITEISGIGEKTAEKLRKRISTRGNRVTGDLTVSDVTTQRGQTFAQNVLASNQQKALSEATMAFTPDRESRQKMAKKQSQQRSQTGSDTIRRGDFTVQKDSIETAREKFNDLPDDKRSEDKSEREPVVTNVDLWSENISRFDFPGVDTPSNRRVRAEPSDSVLNGTNSQTRPRENWRESQPEQTETQQQLGEQPDKADAERTGIYRASDGEFVERPLQPAGDGRFVSPNGQVVTQPLQDPTIGRDPDDGEFVDMPLSTEPSVPLPNTGVASGSHDGFSGVGSRTDEQRRLEEGEPPEQALQEQQQSLTGMNAGFEQFGEDVASELEDTYQDLEDRGFGVDRSDVAEVARDERQQSEEYGIPKKDPTGLAVVTANRFKVGDAGGQS